VYQWVGEWKEQSLGSLYFVKLASSNNFPAFKDYKDFQLVTERDFFAVTTKSKTGNNYTFRIYYKNSSIRGRWDTFSKTIDVGEGTPTLLSGTNFIALAPFKDDSSHPCQIFTFNGNSWTESKIDQTTGDHYYTAKNNFIFSQNLKGADGKPEFNFYHLTADKKWDLKTLISTATFSTTHPCIWSASNGLAVAKLASNGNSGFVYRWDMSYTNFYNDKDIENKEMFPGLGAHTPIAIVNNSLVGIGGRLARFDGKYWYSQHISSSSNSPFGFYFSYGDDIVVRPTEYVSSTMNYEGARKVFNPNTLAWQGDISMTESDNGADFANVGNDYYYFGNGYYYRKPNGSWIKKNTISDYNSRWCYGGAPRFDVWYFASANKTEVTYFKNGTLSTFTIPGFDPVRNSRFFRSQPTGNQTFVLHPTNSDRSVKIFRLINDAIEGQQIDYPVKLVTVVDGTNVQYTTFDYNATTATIDPSGNFAQYNEVTIIPGSTSISSTPYGYSKTFFNNGLSGADFVNTSTDLHWLGAPCESQHYDANGNKVSYTKTTYTLYNRDLINGNGVKVESGSYARPTKIINMVDEIVTTTVKTYDINTGLISRQKTTGPVNSQIDYKYFWEVYDASRSMNLLSPLIQTKLQRNDQVTLTNVVRFKKWTAARNPSGVYSPYDQYTWKGTGLSDFSAWDVNANPSHDWQLVRTVISLESNTGIILESANDYDQRQCTLLNAFNQKPIAHISNSTLSDAAYNSFEDTATGNFNTIEGVVQQGNSKTGNSYLVLGTSGLFKAGLSTDQTYKISCWIKSNGGTINIDGVGAVNLGILDQWTLFEYNVSGVNAIRIKQTGTAEVMMDEVRLHPVKATMTTFCYHPVFGVISQNNINGQVTHHEFDEWGRLKNMKDGDNNIITSYYYNIKN
jgi:hypothetical protein